MGVKYQVDSDFFRNWSNKMAYVLGFVSADGSLEDASYLRGKYLRICCCDLEIIQKIKAVMGSEHKIVFVKPKEVLSRGKKYLCRAKYLLRIGSHKIYNDLFGLGITPNKSKTLKLPCIPPQFLGSFCRGYLDGDGCISIDGKKHNLVVVFTSGSKIFLEELSKSLGVVLGINKHKVYDSNRAFQLKYSTREAVPLLKYIYSEPEGQLFLERKQQIFSGYLKKHPKWQ